MRELDGSSNQSPFSQRVSAATKDIANMEGKLKKAPRLGSVV